MNKRKIGNAGEDFAAAYMQKNGMRLLERNYYCRMGEIDIIAQDGDTVVFAEVKTRAGKSYGTAAEAVTRAKMDKLVKTAYTYIEEKGLHDSNCRFDIAEVYGKGGRFEINYIKNAFEARL